MLSDVAHSRQPRRLSNARFSALEGLGITLICAIGVALRDPSMFPAPRSRNGRLDTERPISLVSISPVQPFAARAAQATSPGKGSS